MSPADYTLSVGSLLAGRLAFTGSARIFADVLPEPFAESGNFYLFYLPVTLLLPRILLTRFLFCLLVLVPILPAPARNPLTTLPKSENPSVNRQKKSRTQPKSGKHKQSRKSPVVRRKQTSRLPVRQSARQRPAAAVTGRRALSGTVFYLASGHGGPDPGAIGRFGKQRLPEDEYAYDVTIRLQQLLKQQGATVYMMIQDPNDGIRNTAILKLDQDEVAYPRQRIPLNQVARLTLTTSAVNRLYAQHRAAYQRFITIHVDSRSQGQNIDVFFYHHERSKVGRRLAQHIHRRFQTNYRRYQPGRPYLGTVSPRTSLFMVRKSHPPTVFIELGNIQNPQDQRRFLEVYNRQALANWMAQGILDDYRSR